MSRLESTAQAGYFPTAPRVIAAIAGHLPVVTRNGKWVVRLLDPCAGTGAAAQAIAHSLGAESYGIEINEKRAGEAVTHLDHVLTTSAFSMRLANGAFSLLLVNPLYADDEEHRRLEHAFLTSLTRALGPGGILVLIIPQRRLATSALPGQPLYCLSNLSVPRPGVRRLLADRALRRPQTASHPRPGDPRAP